MKETQPVIEALATCAGFANLKRELGDQAADRNLVLSLQSYGEKANERFHELFEKEVLTEVLASSHGDPDLGYHHPIYWACVLPL